MTDMNAATSSSAPSSSFSWVISPGSFGQNTNPSGVRRYQLSTVRAAGAWYHVLSISTAENRVA